MSFQKSRIAKLERIHRTGDELFYLVWGADEVSAQAALVEAREAGQVGDEDLAVCAVWPHAAEPPSTRWVMRREMRFEPAVDDVLFDLMVARMEAESPGCYARATARSSERPAWPPGVPAARSADELRAAQMTDSELYAAAMARPVRVLLGQ
jgi:hypothetical protein